VKLSDSLSLARVAGVVRDHSAQASDFGIWSCLDSPAAIGMLGRSGVDYVCIDLQHGMSDPAALPELVAAIAAGGALAVVRAPWNRPDAIMRILDSGARVVVVPMVDDMDQATAAIEACSYPPTGIRSWGPFWPDLAFSPEVADAGVRCMVMIETAQGFANLEAIAATPGLGGIYVGPNDLALTLGYGRATYDTDERIHAAIETVAAVAAAAGIVAGLHCSSVAMAKYWSARGFGMLTVATDTSLIAAAVQSTTGDLFGGTGSPITRGY
jgi:4-hydroxy-2-oxoheptanedioate aldolase